MSVAIRPARDDDADAFVAIVSASWAEYPGCVTDILGEAPELHALATAMAHQGGHAWAACVDGAVAGLVACWPREAGIWELGKMYVAARHRGTGVAPALLQTAETFAKTHGAAELTLWSDTRFSRAHAFYERHGFLRTGPIRALDDRSHTIEFGFSKPLVGVEVRVLDAAAAASAPRALADILVTCVAGSASVSFLPPLAPDVARGFWRRAATQVATGRRILVVAWADGVLSGVVTVDCDTPQNQPHRADIQKMLVLPGARRRGIARALMQAAEQAARDAGRRLLTLDTASDAAEALYRSLGYTVAGRIPGYALDGDGRPLDTALYYKALGSVGD